MTDFIEIVSEHGPWLGIVVVLGSALGAYIRRDWKRMDILEKRVTRLEDELKSGYRELILPCHTAVVTVNKLLEKFLLRD